MILFQKSSNKLSFEHCLFKFSLNIHKYLISMKHAKHTNHNQLPTSLIFYLLWLQFQQEDRVFVLDAIKHKFYFDVLCNPIDITTNQIQFLLPLLPVIHCEWCHFVRPRYFTPRQKLLSKVFYGFVNGNQLMTRIFYSGMVFKLQSLV